MENITETEETAMRKKRLGAALLSLCLLAGTIVPVQAENTHRERMF